MNRTIKFRGKNLYNNEWIFGDLIQYESGEMAIFSNKLSQYGCEATEMFPMQSFPKPQVSSPDYSIITEKKYMKETYCLWATMNMKIYTIKQA